MKTKHREFPGLVALSILASIVIGVPLLAVLHFAGVIGTVAEYSAAYEIVRGNTPDGYTGKAISWAKSLLGADNQQPVNSEVPISFSVDTPSITSLKIFAEHGDANAAYNLGVAYMNGAGVPQNAAEAVKWYDMAADQGNADAETILGELACPQQVLTKSCNIYQADVWLYLGKANGNQKAAKELDAVEKIECAPAC